MRYRVMLLCVVVLATTTAQAADARSSSLKKTAQILFQALIDNKPKEVRLLMLTHAELSALSTKAVKKNEFERVCERWIKMLSANLSRPRKTGKVAVAGVEILDALIIGKSSKTPRPVVFVTVLPRLKIGDKVTNGVPVFFVKAGETWKLSPRR